jgi:hypothetical protein
MATLKIYNSVQDQEPSKVYNCYRLTMELDNKLNALVEETSLVEKEIKEVASKLTDKSSDEEIEQVKAKIKSLEEKASRLTLDTIRLFFPEFSIDDFNKLDPYDYQTFVFEIGELRNRILNRAAKN